MKIAVRYYSRGGNTRKLAEAVGKAVGADAEPVTAPLEEDVDVLFLGAAPYAFDVDEEVKSFIRGIRVSVGKAVLFSTSAMVRSIRGYVEKLFADRKIPVADEEFSCRGEFLMLHKGKPNESDLRAAAEFAKKMTAS